MEIGGGENREPRTSGCARMARPDEGYDERQREQVERRIIVQPDNRVWRGYAVLAGDAQTPRGSCLDSIVALNVTKRLERPTH